MKKLIPVLWILAALATPIFAGVTIDYDVEQAVGPTGRQIQTRHRHYYTRDAMRADVKIGGTEMILANAYINVKEPFIQLRIGNGKIAKLNIHEYEDSVLPDAIVTPLDKTRTVLECETKGYKFKANHIEGTFWLCSDPQWAEANNFTSSLLKILEPGAAGFRLYEQLLGVMNKTGVVFEFTAKNNKDKTIFSAHAISAKQAAYTKGFIAIPENTPAKAPAVAADKPAEQ